MNEKLERDLYQFADNGQDAKDEVFKNVMDRIDAPVKFNYKRLIPAAISLCLIVAVIGNFNIIADSISNIIGSITMNEIRTNRLQELYDLSLYSARIAGTAVVLDEDSIEYQIVYGTGEPEKPCYIYLFYYRGYLKMLIFDEDTKNIDEVDEWLKNNGGIVARAANTIEEAEALLSGLGSSVAVTPAKIREVMGDDCVLPAYFPDGRKSGNMIQCNVDIGTVNITYYFEGKADFDPNGVVDNYIALGISKTDTEYGKNLTENLAVTKSIAITQINGHEVYSSDDYYVWESKGLVYILYTTFAPYEEVIKIIENMK